ncbi:Transcriptional regulator, AsnC family [Nitrosarchaeum koreense MY1]|uniref:Transcriptional regulator, AsnC family n=2 Tax=Nitrosarchaeum TaxID=1007082 RepID=F9CYH5_9ARCH|nr:Transcriptional regulator, AsnC family [Nitrosarchaeum koreense MY1]
MFFIAIEMEKAYMLISCEIGEEHSIYLKLKEIPEIKDCTITFGNYDIVVSLETETITQLNNIISTKIRKVGKIRSTITLRVTT